MATNIIRRRPQEGLCLRNMATLHPARLTMTSPRLFRRTTNRNLPLTAVSILTTTTHHITTRLMTTLPALMEVLLPLVQRMPLKTTQATTTPSAAPSHLDMATTPTIAAVV